MLRLWRKQGEVNTSFVERRPRPPRAEARSLTTEDRNAPTRRAPSLAGWRVPWLPSSLTTTLSYRSSPRAAGRRAAGHQHRHLLGSQLLLRFAAEGAGCPLHNSTPPRGFPLLEAVNLTFGPRIGSKGRSTRPWTAPHDTPFGATDDQCLHDHSVLILPAYWSPHLSASSL